MAKKKKNVDWIPPKGMFVEIDFGLVTLSNMFTTTVKFFQLLNLISVTDCYELLADW